MGIWTGELAVEGATYGLLLDSVTMMPLAMGVFPSPDDADAFLGWAAAQGYPDVRGLRAATLDVLRAQWETARAEWLRLHGDDAEDEADADADELLEARGGRCPAGATARLAGKP